MGLAGDCTAAAGAANGGSALFGFGWGLTGVCPGPAVVDYVTGGAHFGVTVPCMLLGMALFEAGKR